MPKYYSILSTSKYTAFDAPVLIRILRSVSTALPHHVRPLVPRRRFCHRKPSLPFKRFNRTRPQSSTSPPPPYSLSLLLVHSQYHYQGQDQCQCRPPMWLSSIHPSREIRFYIRYSRADVTICMPYPSLLGLALFPRSLSVTSNPGPCLDSLLPRLAVSEVLPPCAFSLGFYVLHTLSNLISFLLLFFFPLLCPSCVTT